MIRKANGIALAAAAFGLLVPPAWGGEKTLGHRPIPGEMDSIGGDVSAAPPVGSTGSGTGVFRSVYNTSHAIVVPQGFLGTIACAVTDAWGNLSPVYAIDA